MKKKKKRRIIIPINSTIFVGTKSEWEREIGHLESDYCKVSLRLNGGSFVDKKLVWCNEKGMLFVSHNDFDKLNINNYTNNYRIKMSPSVLAKKKSSNPKSNKISEERLIQEEKRLRENEIKNAKEISYKDFIKDNTERLYALKFPHGTNLQKSLYSNRDCRAKKHYLCQVIAVLQDKDKKWNKIGKIYYCKDCKKAYLGKITKNSISYDKYPDYSFEDWMIYELSDELKKERSKYPLLSPVKDNDTVLINEGSTVFYGDDLIHIDDDKHKLITCRIGMLSKERDQYYFYKKTEYCPICKKYYLPFDVSTDLLQSRFNNYRFAKASGCDTQIAERDAKELEKLLRKGNTKVLKSEDFLVRTSSFSCRTRKHKCKEITAVVTVFRTDKKIQDVFIPGWYCENCKCYYISESDFEKIDKMGVIIAKVYTEKEWNSSERYYKDYSELNTRSLLNKLGYTVSAEYGLSDSTRQEILTTAVDFKLMTINEITDFLTWLINIRSYDDKYQNAIAKWERDRKYISRYRMHTREHIKIKSIRL